MPWFDVWSEQETVGILILKPLFWLFKPNQPITADQPGSYQNSVLLFKARLSMMSGGGGGLRTRGRGERGQTTGF